MTQFVIATAALNHDSKFAAAYTKGMKKAEYWQPTLEDSLDCVAKSFTVAARSLPYSLSLRTRTDACTRRHLQQPLPRRCFQDRSPPEGPRSLVELCQPDRFRRLGWIRRCDPSLQRSPQCVAFSLFADGQLADDAPSSQLTTRVETFRPTPLTSLDPPSPTPSSPTLPPSADSLALFTASPTRRSSASSSVRPCPASLVPCHRH